MGLLGFGTVLAMVPFLLQRLAGTGLGRGRDLHHTHRAPVPRWGGLALAVAFVLVEFVALLYGEQVLPVPERLTLFFAPLAMFGLGFLDDVRPLGAQKKFLAQIVIATAVWAAGFGVSTFRIPLTDVTLQLGWWGWFLTVLWLVGMTNLINLIDGVDGLAGGICLMLMGLTAYLSYGRGTCDLLAAGMAGALLGFLKFNFPPARIYLGDGGAYFLGFQIGLYAIVNSQKGTIAAALIAPLFVLTLPIVDTGLAILRRGLRGLPLFRPDKRHIHHRLLGMGLSRRRVVLSIYGLTLVFLVLGLFAFWSQGRLLPVLGGIAVLIMLICAGNLSFSREWFAVGRVVGNSLYMRGEIHYALALTRWLAMDGGRCGTIDQLWADLVWAAEKLGFRALKLTLADGARSWQAEGMVNDEPRTLYAFPTGIGGHLELWAPGQAAAGPGDGVAAKSSALKDVYEITGELLAEGWLKAAQAWSGDRTTPLGFASDQPQRADRGSRLTAALWNGQAAKPKATPPAERPVGL